MVQSAVGIAVGAGIVYGAMRGGKLLFGKYALNLDVGSRVIFTESGILLPPKCLALEQLHNRAGWFAFQAKKVELIDRCYSDVVVAISASELILNSTFASERFNRADVPHIEMILDRQFSSRETARLIGVRWNFLRSLFNWFCSLGESVIRKQKAEVHCGDWLVVTANDARLCQDDLVFEEIFYRKSDAISFLAREIETQFGSWRDVPVRLTPSELKIGDTKFNPEAVPRMEVVTDRIVLPREAMGLGDVKFMAAIGAFLGWQAVLFTLIVASMIGAAYGTVMVALHRQKWSGRLYFGPFLAVAATIWIFAGPELVAWYLRFSQQVLNRLLGH
jgi:prepilin signal peptidase PulO-like enzyme (type II secretory pathway)